MDCLFIIIIFGLAVIINLWAETRNIEVLRYYSKPLLMPLLAFYYWIMVPETNFLVLAALWVAFVGDVLLMFPEKKTFFILGLLAFLACQFCYLIFFALASSFPYGIPPLFWSVSLAYAGAGIFIYMKLKKNLEDMKVPVIIYMVVILTMGFVCAARYFTSSGSAYWLPLVGSTLFILSDTILAWDRFRKPVPYRGLFVMSTYIAAQVLIVLGILAG
jgi:uncharacterized membrane protein YhhN